MKKLNTLVAFSTVVAVIAAWTLFGGLRLAEAAKPADSPEPDPAAVERSRQTVAMLDNIYKQTVVLITEKYVHDEDDFAAGSAAVLLFKNISESGSHQVRLIDATGKPYEAKNVAKDAFERESIKRLKAGAAGYEQVVHIDGKPYLRAATPVPVVMERCIMCHDHYRDVKKGEPIGIISYTVPIK